MNSVWMDIAKTPVVAYFEYQGGDANHEPDVELIELYFTDGKGNPIGPDIVPFLLKVVRNELDTIRRIENLILDQIELEIERESEGGPND